MKRRCALVTAQVPVIFVAGAAWADQLSGLALAFVAVLVGAAWFMHYGWALSLARWQYQVGRVDGITEYRMVQAVQEARDGG